MDERLIHLARSLRGESVLVTGASGRIGRRLLSVLARADVAVKAISRNPVPEFPSSIVHCQADLLQSERLASCLKNVSAVFHLASYAPQPGESKPEQNAQHHDVTVVGTANLMQEAELAGVSTLVFASSTRVIDGSNSLYARAKQQAEQRILSTSGGLETTVMRLSPVYGFATEGSVAQMLAAIDAGRFPPIPDCKDQHSMVHVDDAVQALLLGMVERGAAGKTYTVTDMHVYSSREIYELICIALGRQPSVHAVPKWLLTMAALSGSLLEALTHRRMPLNMDKLHGLCRSAVFDGAPLAELGYSPIHSLQSALPEIVADFAVATTPAQK